MERVWRWGMDLLEAVHEHTGRAVHDAENLAETMPHNGKQPSPRNRRQNRQVEMVARRSARTKSVLIRLFAQLLCGSALSDLRVPV